MLKRLFLLLLVMISLSCDEPEHEVSYTIHTYSFTSSEQDLLNRINDYRVSIGLNALTQNQHISYLCWEHNIYIINSGLLNHDYFQYRVDNLIATLHAKRVGENIAYNYITNQSVLNAWLNSPGHRENIEGDYTDFGLSTVNDENRNYTTLILIKR